MSFFWCIYFADEYEYDTSIFVGLFFCLFDFLVISYCLDLDLDGYEVRCCVFVALFCTYGLPVSVRHSWAGRALRANKSPKIIRGQLEIDEHMKKRTCILGAHCFTHRTDHRFLLDDADLPGKADTSLILIMCDLPHVAGWEPYNLHDLSSTWFLGWTCTTYTDPAHHLMLERVGYFLRRWGCVLIVPSPFFEFVFFHMMFCAGSCCGMEITRRVRPSSVN